MPVFGVVVFFVFLVVVVGGVVSRGEVTRSVKRDGERDGANEREREGEKGKKEKREFFLLLLFSSISRDQTNEHTKNFKKQNQKTSPLSPGRSR